MRKLFAFFKGQEFENFVPSLYTVDRITHLTYFQKIFVRLLIVNAI